MTPVRRFSHETKDPDEGHEVLRDLYAEHKVRLRPSAERTFVLRIDLVACGTCSIGTVWHSGDAQIDLAAGLRATSVTSLHRTPLALEHRQRALALAPGQSALLPAGAPLAAHWPSHDATSVSLDDELLHRDAAALLGDSPLVIDVGPPRSAAAELHWRQTVSFVRATALGLERAHTATPLAVRSLLSLLNSALLATFPNSADAVGRPSAPAAAPSAVTRAQAFIESAPDRPLDLVDIAEAARVSPRTLQALFRRHTGHTPTGYLRRVRLDHARHELLFSDRPVTVGQVAARWGWSNAGRFAQAYREAYGLNPADELRRS